MSVSLTNKRNTRIIETTEDIAPGHHFVRKRELIHHGSNTCTIWYTIPDYAHHPVATDIMIDTCGWDTVTTRGKINKFLAQCNLHRYGLVRIKGETRLHTSWNGDKSCNTEFNGKVNIRLV